jgi:spermidine synthase
LQPVIDWHAAGRLPLGTQLANDPRVTLVQGDFFAWARDRPGDCALADRYDVVLLDIDHASDFLLHPSHASLYTPEGLRALADRLTDDGVFAFWSSEPEEDRLADRLRSVFPAVVDHAVEFYDPGFADYDVNTVLVARK